MRRFRLWLIRRMAPPTLEEVRRFHGQTWVLASIESHIDYQPSENQMILIYRRPIQFMTIDRLAEMTEPE